jgi:hypothetical protein
MLLEIKMSGIRPRKKPHIWIDKVGRDVEKRE